MENSKWLKSPAAEPYRGQWVGLRAGRLLGSAETLPELVKAIGRHGDVLYTRVKEGS